MVLDQDMVHYSESQEAKYATNTIKAAQIWFLSQNLGNSDNIRGSNTAHIKLPLTREVHCQIHTYNTGGIT